MSKFTIKDVKALAGNPMDFERRIGELDELFDNEIINRAMLLGKLASSDKELQKENVGVIIGYAFLAGFAIGAEVQEHKTQEGQTIFKLMYDH